MYLNFRVVEFLVVKIISFSLRVKNVENVTIVLKESP